ncbi:MAG TPA: adenylate/guanylate cyclase domain-containing protein [Methylophilaceae bacterium]|nr:adenylate/guanylate cyclase domain-containing protein [Methylophilaceae bacterium]
MSRRFLTDTSNSEDRLARLIADRLAPGADKEKIDQRIWDLFGEEWCVMFTDLSGFSRRVAEFGIIHFLQTIYESERLLLPVIESHDGFVLKSEGDSLLAIFRNPCKALQGAVSMQHVLGEYNQTRPDEEKVLLCVGLGYGHMLRVGDIDIFGAEVNAASKLGEDIAKAGDILVTGAFKKACGDGLNFPCKQLPNTPAGADSAYRVHYS